MGSLNELKIIHRDLKPNNILFNNNKLKLFITYRINLNLSSSESIC